MLTLAASLMSLSYASMASFILFGEARLRRVAQKLSGKNSLNSFKGRFGIVGGFKDSFGIVDGFKDSFCIVWFIPMLFLLI